MSFAEEYSSLWKSLGESKIMVLSTSLNNVVTSRPMSIIILDNNKLYFQTDRTFRKYEQLKGNPVVALCVENIQIEGQCKEVGVPSDNTEFCNAYKKHFTSSFNRYSSLENERLFMVQPTFIERWRYINNLPYMETFDVQNNKHILQQYSGV